MTMSVREVKSVLSVCVLVVLCCLDLSISLPAEQPTKFTLNTGDSLKNIDSRLASTLDQVQTVASESQINPLKTETLNHPQRSVEVTQQPPVTNTRPNARETVRLENEAVQGFFEKPIPKPVNGVLESFLRPTPLVDGITERDKYGNTGDKFIGIGRALVGGFEGFSNFLNAVVDFPRNAAKKTSRGITEALNYVGAKLVGLE